METSAAVRPARQDHGHDSARPRLAVVDAVRGVAIVAVVVYHLVWDLGDLDLIAGHPAQTESGRAIAHGIAGTFVFLVGVSAVLAHGRGLRVRPFLRRLGELLAYAALISIATYLVMPGSWVSFGILHCLAVVSVLGLPFVRHSRALAVGAAVLAVALPGLITIPGDSRWWSWTGLTEAAPPSIDSAPILPMFALALVGIVLMRTLRERGLERRLAQIPCDRGLGRALAFLGRHTLVIYVVHQPVLLGLLHAYLALR